MSRQDHGGGAAHDDVLTEGGHPNREIAVELGHRAITEGLDGRLYEGAIEEFDGAAEHDLAEIEGPDHRGEGDAEPFAGTTQDVVALGRVRRGFELRGEAGVATQVSRQPRLPQAQASPPSVPTTTWPISPAANRLPNSGMPPSSRPAPTPWPTLMSIMSLSASPKLCSARAAAFASFATRTG